MNILILSWRGPGHPNAGGAEKSTYEHAKGWVKAGHKVTLFTSSFGGAKLKDSPSGIQIIRSGGQVFTVHLKAIWWYLFGNHPKFDIVVDEVHGIPFFTPLFVKKPKLVFIHEVAKEVWKLNPWPRPFNLLPAIVGTLLEPLIFKILYKNVPFMTVSQSTKDDLIAWSIPKEGITVIHNGFIAPSYKIGEKEEKNTIIYLGALSKDKGIEDALLIFKKLFEVDKNIQFWVVGKGERYYLTYLKERIKSLGINKAIKFFGFVSDKEKFDLLSRAHILINPSIREGWGFVVIEAASVGTPTVAFDVPGLRDSILNGKTGIIDKRHSVNSIASEIMDLLNDNHRYQRMRLEAIKRSNKFSWDKASKGSLTLLTKIVSSSNF